MGFRPSDADDGLLYQDDDSSRTLLLVYVDDILIVARTKAEVKFVIDELISVFDAHDLGDAHFYLSISIERDRAKDPEAAPEAADCPTCGGVWAW